MATIKEFSMYPIKKLIDLEGYFTAFDTIYPKNYYFPGEMHDFWEMVYVKSGTVTATGDANIYNLQKGGLIFHKPMEFHRIWSANGEKIRFAVVSFKAGGRGMNSFKNSCFALNDEEQARLDNVFNAFFDLNKISESSNFKTHEYRIASSKAAALLEGFLVELVGKKSLDFEPHSQDEINYHKAVEFMTEHCGENLSVNDIANALLMSVSNLKRIFAKYSNIGVAKYFLNLKIRKAKQLLDEGLSAVQTAASLGFSEPCYFHTTFKRETGLTPKEYQKIKEL